MNSRLSVATLFAMSFLTLPSTVLAIAVDTNDATTPTYDYDFSNLTIPADAGGESWFDDRDRLFRLDALASIENEGHVTLTVNGTQVSTAPDGATVYATNNPGIGIALELNYSTPSITSPEGDKSAPYEIVFNRGFGATGYVHVKYTIVRLTAHVPAGKITSGPQVTLNYFNVPTIEDYPNISFLALSGAVSGQPKITACTINAPTEVKLSPLYGNNIVNGAQGVTNVPTINLTNCPGAVDKISYTLSAVYGTHDAANGVLKTEAGEGYANNVYVQVQNADGSAHLINSAIALNNYTGSGNYDIPDFKVAYFIDDAQSVTAGSVKTALEFNVTYN